ncbi:MAG: hypothetical protein J6H21_02600 [Firmicutes bacterium]|nr:hypothetical protein [Bacillota bacterium]
MNILVVLRNLYGNPDPFEDELLVGDSDVNAISEACEIRDLLLEGKGAKVTCLLFSESQSQSEKALIKAASYGADEVCHIPIDDFDFTDANTFSKVIAGIIREHFPGDLVIFGRLAYDGDSVNISTQVAENLGYSRGIYSKKVEKLSQSLVFRKALETGDEALVEVPLPAVLHTIRKEGLRRQAKIADIIRAHNEVTVQRLSQETGKQAAKIAMEGAWAGTWKEEVPPYQEATDMVVLNGISDIETAQNLIDTLKVMGFEPK